MPSDVRTECKYLHHILLLAETSEPYKFISHIANAAKTTAQTIKSNNNS